VGKKLLFNIGDTVPHYGVVSAVGIIGGERYYWFTLVLEKTVSVSMIPECAFPAGTKARKRRKK
jgi:hypothetical protein